jgi:hypothetical protein
MAKLLQGVDSLKTIEACDLALKGLKLIRKVTKRKSKITHDQNQWGYHSGSHKPDEKNYCGTTACVAGQFALSKEGRELGIKSRWEQTVDGDAWKLVIGKQRDDYAAVSGVATHISKKTHIPIDCLIGIFRGADHSVREKWVALDRIDTEIAQVMLRRKEIKKG